MNCIKRLPRSAGTYSADTEYLPQDRVFCDGSIFVSLRRQSGNRPSVTVGADGTYDTADGWMVIAVGASVPGGGQPPVGNPSINGVELVGDRTAAELGLASAGDVPTRMSELENDGGYLTEGRLKTVNGQSLVGEGDVRIEGGGSSVTVDPELSDTSENPVQNRIVKEALDSKQDKGDYALRSDIPDVAGLATKSEVERVEGQAATNAASILRKVDKVDGKGLSANDYTDEDKAKVGRALTEHQSLSDYYTKEEVDSKVASGGTFDPTVYYRKAEVDALVEAKQDKGDYALKSDIPDVTDLAKKTDIPDVTGLATKSEVSLVEEQTAANAAGILEKVDKVEGKQLSTNDYTDSDKAKVASAITEHQDISGKQDVISDLETIRSGAAKGATALQSYTESDPVYTKDKPTLALKSEIPDVSGFAKKSDIPDTSGLVRSSDLAEVATSGDYNDLTNKPTIPSAVTEETVSGWGFTKNAGNYSKPTGGIPKSDLASAVQTSLGKADTALQSFTETDPTVPSWAKQSTKPTYTAAEVGALPSTTKIPSKTSDLSNDSGFLTEHQQLKTVNGESLIGEGDITIKGGGDVSLEYDISSIYTKVFASTSGTSVEITQEEFEGVFAACEAGKTLCYYVSQGEKARDPQYYTYSDERGEHIVILDDISIGSEAAILYSIYIDFANSKYTAYYNKDRLSVPDMSGYVKDTQLGEYAKTTEVESKISAAIAAIPPSERTVVKTNESTIGFGTSNILNIPSIELAADKFHIVGRCSGLTITLPDGSDTDGKEYVCQFYVGSNYKSYTLTLPDTVAWLNGEAPTFESGACYMLSIVNNCAIVGKFRQSS